MQLIKGVITIKDKVAKNLTIGLLVCYAVNFGFATKVAFGNSRQNPSSNTEMVVNTIKNRDQSFNTTNNYIVLSENNNTPMELNSIMEIKLDDDESIRVGVGSKDQFENALDVAVENVEYSVEEGSEQLEVDVTEITDLVDTVKEEIRLEEEAKKQAALTAKSYTDTQTQGGLVDIAEPDVNYHGSVVELSPSDRDLFERLVFGEAGDQGFIGQCLVAQCIRDMWILGDFHDANTLRTSCGYSGSIHNGTTDSCKQAVSYIFDQGGYAVQHRILYFYAFEHCNSKFHESQNFVIQYKGHRVFDRW